MKKISSKPIVVFLSLMLIVALLSACAPAASTQAPAASTQAPAATKQLRAAMVTAQRLGDQGVTDLIHSGFQRAAKDFNYETKVVEVQKGEYEEAIRSLAEDGYDVIATLYVELVDATGKVAPDYPNVKFITVLGEIEAPNVKGLLGQEHEGSYLAGVEAGMMTKTDHIGFIGGQDNAEINRFLAGYEQGAKAVNPDIKIDAVYVGSFEDPTKGKDLALLLYNQGADIVYAAAAKSGLGMFEAAKETGKYCIGVDVNQNGVAPGHVIGSMTISYDAWIYDAMKEIAQDQFKPGVFWFGLKGDFVGLALPTPDQFQVPSDVLGAIEEAKTKFNNGELTIDPVPEKDK